jgi:alpha-D-xyloside xylohydrolase
MKISTNSFLLCAAAALVAASLTTSPVTAAFVPVQSFQKNADGVTLAMSPGKMKLTVCSDSIVRVMYSPTATLPAGQDFVVTNHSWPRTSFKVADANGKLTLITRKLKVAVDKATGAVAFYDTSGKLLLSEPADGGKKMTPATVNGETSFRPEQSFVSPPDEFLYGLGQFQEGIWNWRGMPEQLRQLNTEISLPMIVSSYGYGLLWNNASLTDFNPVDTQVALTNRSGTYTTGAAGEYVFMVADGDRRGEIGVQVNGQTLVAITNMWVTYNLSAKTTLPANTTCSVTLLGGGRDAKIFARPLGNTTTFRSEVGDAIDYYFFYGPTADEIIAGYRQATGDAPLFPEAAYGFWQCRERYSSQEQMLSAASEFRARQIPVDFIVQDWQYWGNHGWGAYEWDLSHYPNPSNMIAQLHDEHFKYMISVWSNPSGIVGRALAAMPHGLIPGSQWMDVFNPAVRSLRWKYMDQAFFSIGADAWWQDATEPGDDGNSVSGVQCFLGSANRVRNSYPLFASEATYEGQRGTDSSKRVVILSRSAYLGQQRYAAAAWSGDVSGDWLTFARQIRGGLNYSITGLPYWTTDTGGFFHPRDQYTSPDYNELLTRWFQWSTFCPILRIHGYTTTTEIWKWLPATQTNLIAFDDLRYRMLPYNYSVAWKITSEGYTLMRALVMDFPHDPNALAISDEYMFGPAFLACPVTTAQATSRAVYLPSGTSWVDFWTGETLAGGKTVTANAPISIMPLFVRAGSIVPLGPVMQYATEKPEDPIELRVYRGADGKFTLYEDEGDNYNYEKGKYATIPISWNEARHTLEIGKRTGSFPGMLKERAFNIVWVSGNHGIGIATEEQPDAVVNYTGKAVKLFGPQ